LILPWFMWRLWLIWLPILAIIFGGIGISKDDSKGLGVAGLILGIVALIIWIIIPILLLMGLFGSLFSLI
ncbi:MAG: hypothetical protein R3255_09365, partial [Candidatus Lokiarchaeia archaeon]|nr:hypothetical protein [Candidatus Lokiarchaeia archaeon]